MRETVPTGEHLVVRARGDALLPRGEQPALRLGEPRSHLAPRPRRGAPPAPRGRGDVEHGGTVLEISARAHAEMLGGQRAEIVAEHLAQLRAGVQTKNFPSTPSLSASCEEKKPPPASVISAAR